MNNSLTLKFNGRAIKEDFVLPAPPDLNSTYLWKLDAAVVHPDLNQYFEETIKLQLLKNFPGLETEIKNSSINFVQLFYTPPNAGRNIHTDGRNLWGLNYVIPQDSDSHMSWYEPLANIEKQPKETIIGTRYFTYELNEVQLLENQRLQGLCLVSTNIPHAVSNLDARGRYAFSFRSLDIVNIITFEQAYKYLEGH